MHDARALLEMGADAVGKLARRGYTLDLRELDTLFSRRTETIRTVDQLREESNLVTLRVQQAARQGRDVDHLREQARELKEQIRQAEAERDRAADELQGFMLGIPNLPLDSLPDGDSEDFAVEVRRRGNPPSFAFEPRDHVDLGEAMRILDFARATKLSGPRFSVARGPGAALERALATFFLDLHTQRHGYTEYSLPNLVTRETMTGTGQLPKFEDDLFGTSVGSRDLFLIPTAEVPLTNLHAAEIIDPTPGLPIGRTMAAILENYQHQDGSVSMPEALIQYLGFKVLSADGTARAD